MNLFLKFLKILLNQFNIFLHKLCTKTDFFIFGFRTVIDVVVTNFWQIALRLRLMTEYKTEIDLDCLIGIETEVNLSQLGVGLKKYIKKFLIQIDLNNVISIYYYITAWFCLNHYCTLSVKPITFISLLKYHCVCLLYDTFHWHFFFLL